ncbi:hypothetical protein [uncultured Gammaproteobacteria bacterium]|jgi:hypothetical protein|nr:hypothetical protein [uncultured Gammaproteobacteria bacterium]CAC9618752.1 hypothetical protein [uncultured Gammaproteobacteria bacterium]CAC9620568.1 hypothetical protein [uncultured Gammaproteobacteria bacterium]CAC9963752.1 hypothetical protein [uncultured Gammaproteobacteria bacterium]
MIINKKNSTITFDNLVQNPTSIAEIPKNSEVTFDVFKNKNHKGDFPLIHTLEDLEDLHATGVKVANNTLALLK